jgi:hypothetical protein
MIRNSGTAGAPGASASTIRGFSGRSAWRVRTCAYASSSVPSSSGSIGAYAVSNSCFTRGRSIAVVSPW